MILKRALTTMALVGVMATQGSMVFASTTAPVAQSATQEQRASIAPIETTLRYSDFLIDGEVWVDLNLQGATFTETDPNEIRDAISTNYEVDTTLALRNDGKGIEFGVYEARPNVSYKDEWVITIDQSVLSVDYDLTTTIKVRDNVSWAPKVNTDRETLTRAELTDGVVVTFDIEGALFNTACTGQYIRRSIMNTSNIHGLYVVPFCDYTSNRISFYIKAMNGVSIHESKLTFEFDQQATNAYNPIRVTMHFTN